MSAQHPVVLFPRTTDLITLKCTENTLGQVSEHAQFMMDEFMMGVHRLRDGQPVRLSLRWHRCPSPCSLWTMIIGEPSEPINHTYNKVDLPGISPLSLLPLCQRLLCVTFFTTLPPSVYVFSENLHERGKWTCCHCISERIFSMFPPHSTVTEPHRPWGGQDVFSPWTT